MSIHIVARCPYEGAPTAELGFPTREEAERLAWRWTLEDGIDREVWEAERTGRVFTGTEFVVGVSRAADSDGTGYVRQPRCGAAA